MSSHPERSNHTGCRDALPTHGLVSATNNDAADSQIGQAETGLTAGAARSDEEPPVTSDARAKSRAVVLARPE
jgi:hypothetical protein